MKKYLLKEESKQPLTILWLDDQREPIKYFAKIAKNKTPSGAEIRNSNFYNNNIFNKYDVTFDWVKNLNEFQQYIINNGMPQFISFDRDLTPKGWDKSQGVFPDGIACAKWLTAYCMENGIKMPKCFAHTANIYQLEELEAALGDAALKQALTPENQAKLDKKKLKLKENNQYNTMKNTRNKIRLTESQLYNVIEETVKKILREGCCPQLDTYDEHGKYYSYEPDWDSMTDEDYKEMQMDADWNEHDYNRRQDFLHNYDDYQDFDKQQKLNRLYNDIEGDTSRQAYLHGADSSQMDKLHSSFNQIKHNANFKNK